MADIPSSPLTPTAAAYRLRIFFLWLFYFAALMIMALPHGMRTVLPPMDCPRYFPCQSIEPMLPGATNADIIRIYQPGDPATLAGLAKNIAENGLWLHISGWPLWPPGMIILESILYRISPSLPVALILVILDCSVWAAAFTALADFALCFRRKAWLALLLPFMMLFSSELVPLLRMGVNSEPLAIGFFLLGTGLLLRSALHENLTIAFAAGLAFSASAYMRAQGDLVMTVALCVTLCTFVLISLKRYRRLSIAGGKAVILSTPWIRLMLAVFFAYYASTFPYRVRHMAWIGPEYNSMWQYVWMTKDKLWPDAQFYLAYGGLNGCSADPELCSFVNAQTSLVGVHAFTAAEYYHFTIHSFLHYPLRWITVKLPLLMKSWFNGTTEPVLDAVFLPFVFIYSLASGRTYHPLLALILGCTAIGVMGPLILIHIEPRYLYLIKILGLYAAGLCIASRLPVENLLLRFTILLRKPPLVGTIFRV